MKREIKFRAWHIKGKCIIDWNIIQATFLGEIIQVFKKQKITDVKSAEYRVPVDGISMWRYKNFNIFEDSDFILMQYTGLKDKNGKEIYEGDIISSYDTYQNKFIEIVRYIIGKQTAGFLLPTRYPNDYQWEIIGNIYENPELLK